MTISYDLAADNTITEAYLYYEDQQAGIGDRFLAEVQQHHHLILKAPFAKMVKGNVRSRMMGRFPYRFFYVVDEARQHIQVLAVLHASRDPGLWPGA